MFFNDVIFDVVIWNFVGFEVFYVLVNFGFFDEVFDLVIWNV